MRRQADLSGRLCSHRRFGFRLLSLSMFAAALLLHRVSLLSFLRWTPSTLLAGGPSGGGGGGGTIEKPTEAQQSKKQGSENGVVRRGETLKQVYGAGHLAPRGRSVGFNWTPSCAAARLWLRNSCICSRPRVLWPRVAKPVLPPLPTWRNVGGNADERVDEDGAACRAGRAARVREEHQGRLCAPEAYRASGRWLVCVERFGLGWFNFVV